MKKMRNNFMNSFNGKKIIVTGHTGFKGSWLSFWLNKLGANVLGISNQVLTHPSFFEACNIKKKINSSILDIRNFKKLQKKILNFKPDYIFHLAAQALVKKSYDQPLLTWESNTLGTINLLETLRNYKKKCTVIIITSDKAYKNLELKRGYKENDILAGTDPYSASKSCADIATQSYIECFFKNSAVRVAIGRAGNVIGGGDWSKDRFIVDCFKSWVKNKPVLIRSPNATRPWQHVLEALSGYLKLAIKLNNNKKLNGQIYNFGPDKKSNYKVIDILKLIKKNWKEVSWIIKKNKKLKETILLKLNSAKAKKRLGWRNVLTINQTVELIIDWYKNYYFTNSKTNNSIINLTNKQIEFYQRKIIK
jgi:CDP-glucose 4,6-dehydratase